MYQQGKALNSASHFELDERDRPGRIRRRWILTGIALALRPHHALAKSARTSDSCEQEPAGHGAF